MNESLTVAIQVIILMALVAALVWVYVLHKKFYQREQDKLAKYNRMIERYKAESQNFTPTRPAEKSIFTDEQKIVSGHVVGITDSLLVTTMAYMPSSKSTDCSSEERSSGLDTAETTKPVGDPFPYLSSSSDSSYSSSSDSSGYSGVD